MRSFLVLVRKDLKGYFDQPQGYIILFLFVGLTSFLFFFFGRALVTEEATVRPLFDIALPVTLVVFIPAATMRLVAEEQRDGTLEILFTQPVRMWTVLFAKFVAAIAFVGIGVLATIAIPLSMMTAGNLDDGAVIAQYVGTFFLTGSFVAIGLFTSSLTRNQIVAFIFAIMLIGLLMLAGLPIVSTSLPPGLAIVVQGLSPLLHFSGIARGVLDLRDVIYFIAIISTFLSATFLMLRGKSVSHRSGSYLNLQLGVAGLVVLSLIIGWFGTSIRGRWDLTESKLFTLSPAANELFSDLDDVVTIRLFTSKEPPVQIAPVARDVSDFLDDVVAASGGNIRLIRKHPDEGDEIKEEARRSFVPPVQFNIQSEGELKIQEGYLGMGITYANRHEVIPFVSDIDGLEYQVAAAVYRMSQKAQRTIAFLYGHGEKRRDAELQSFRSQLEQHHAVLEIEDSAGGFLNLQDADLVVIPGPTEFITGGILDDINNFLANGGKALVLLDPVIVDERFLEADVNRNSGVELVEPYGIALNEHLVFDVQSNETLQFRTRFGTVALAYPYWPVIETSERRISGGVGVVTFPWVSSLDIVEPTEKTLELGEIIPLLETTEFAGVDETFEDISPQSPRAENVPDNELAKRTIAVALTGTRCPVLEPRCEKDPEKQFRMIVVADSDWISESMVNDYRGNLAMGVNTIDWLMQDDALAAIRSKGSSVRPLLFDSTAHRNLVQYGNIVGVPLLFVLVGLVRYLLRRNTTRKVYGVEE